MVHLLIPSRELTLPELSSLYFKQEFKFPK